MLIATTPDVPVTDFRQVRAGAYWHWNSLARAATNRRLFDGDFSSLVDGRSKSARNGLALITDNGDFNPTNWFKSITRFYIDALLAERPELQSDAERRAALFMAENAEKVFQAVEDGMQQRSWGGHFVVTVTDDKAVEAPPSYAYIPVVGNAAQGTPTGHILSYRYAEGSEIPRCVRWWLPWLTVWTSPSGRTDPASWKPTYCLLTIPSAGSRPLPRRISYPHLALRRRL